MMRRHARAGASLIALAAMAPGAALAQQAAGTPTPLQAPAAPASATPAPAAAAVQAAATAAATPAPPPSANGSGSALDVLLRQARYWREQNDPTRAMTAATRALKLSPNNAAALAIIAEVQAGSGKSTEAQQTLAVLQKTSPNAPEIRDVQQAIKIGAISPDALANARQLAQQGQAQQAADAYRALFGGSTPPDSLAVEYYQTLGATPGGYATSLQGLADTARQNPNNLQAQLAYAQALTYRSDTRMQGIDRLAALTRIPSISARAQESWHQALGWLPADQSAISAIKAYQARYPDDPTVKTLMANALNPPNQAPGAQESSEAYDAFHRGDLTQAQALFQKALAANPKDAGATGGLGLVLLKEGRTAEATTLINRAIALDPKQAPGLRQALAGAQLGGSFAAAQSASRRGDLPQAEALYRKLLRSQPNNAGIKLALAGVLSREGNQPEANQLLAEVQASGGSLSDQARAQLLAQQAKGMPDAAGRIALYRSAVDAAPNDPWLRLDLARALVANGQPADAQGVMSAVTDVPRPSAAAVQAGIIFAQETNNSAEAMALIQHVPRRSRTPEMQALLDQAAIQGQITAAVALASSNPMSARQQLMALASQRDPTGARGLAVAKAFAALSDPADAQAAISAAAAMTPNAGGAARLNWAQGLLAAGDTPGASAMLAAIPPGSLTADQQTALNGLQNGIAVRSSDALNTAGRTADAYDQLAPALARSPTDPALNTALARLYQTADQPQKALEINQRILANDPTNVGARQGAVAAAIQLGNYGLASRLVTENMTQNPNDPQNWILAANIAQARGLQADALHDLRQARALRQQQLGYAAVPGGANPSFQVAANGAAATVSPGPVNPFRNAPDSAATTSTASGVLAGSGLVTDNSLAGSSLAAAGTAPDAAATDPMIADLNTRIETIKTAIAPYVAGSTALEFRSGDAGTSQLANFGVPIEASFSPAGVGRITLTATPTYLDAGTLGTGIYDQEQFGSAVFNQTLKTFGGVTVADPGTQTATGVGLDLAYKEKWLSLDAGSTPLGFKITNFVGGIEIAPQLTDQLTFRLTGERRAVTDSLLAYAGTTDPGTGTTWGGVTRTRVHGQLEFNPGLANFYAGGGYDWLQGENVMSNTELELGAGGSYPVYKTPADEVRVGLNLVYFGYAKNEDHFTLGYGGYFSPQTYVAATIPVTWSATRGSLTYTLGGAVGVQTFNADGGQVFPTDAALQSQLGVISTYYASQNENVQTSYASQNQSGIVGGLNGSFEYHLSPMLVVGGSAGYQKTANWNQADLMAFARYTFADSE
ncbi:MAG TPA: cellulose synthase subunit BcsC-related outer membrane protein [Acidisoma sp.]|uniref:cellulose synthase subunit BcsC-related outer membrane protein n=1 Tax=Acidisoma sp. TaxID=1872115 RepID=UPI002CBF2D18|nr:cellulose synthase subunit BcsC-related outer membrane protein [Acidisoma sp.]HTI01968.1 cellulose synthase subunit BcsC-related outer membrane protein [Acidisoma sp.]